MMKWIFAAIAAAALCACAKSSEPIAGSQTHFLASCDDACAAPYECLCGVCTLPCDEDAMCRGQAAGAACVDAAGSCEVSSMMCDLECTEDDACRAVGTTHVCSEGRCRSADGQAGEGGVGGAGGGGGSGGMGASGTGGMGVSGTGGTGGTGGTPPEPLGEICDGSTDMRLGYTIEGGFVDVTYSFTHPYGHSFLFIDGQCHFYAFSDYLAGTMHGTLSDDQARNIAEAIEWDRLDELAGNEDESCPDAAGNMIWAPGGRQVFCTCGCDEGPLFERKAAAITFMTGLTEMLSQADTPLSGPVSALAAAAGEPFGSSETWPLDRPVHEIEHLLHDLDDLGDVFALFEDSDDATALRQLRAEGAPGTPVIVNDSGTYYVLFVRDELPEGVPETIDRLRQPRMP